MQHLQKFFGNPGISALWNGCVIISSSPSTSGGETNGPQGLHIMLVLLMVGLWHKASWNWVCFGLMHGSALVLYRQWNLFNRTRNFSLPTAVSVPLGLLFMYSLYFFSGLFHRADDLSQVDFILSTIALGEGWHIGIVDYLLYAFQFLGPLILYETFIVIKKDEFFILKAHQLIRALMVALALSSVTLFERTAESTFIYFDF